MAIDEPKSGSDGYTNLPLNFGSNNEMNLRQAGADKAAKGRKEHFIGDRILVGNNLPFFG